MNKRLRMLSCVAMMALPLALPIAVSADENPQFRQQMEQLRGKLEADRQKLEADREQMRADREQMEQLRKQMHDAWEDHRDQREQHASNAPAGNPEGTPSKMPSGN